MSQVFSIRTGSINHQTGLHLVLGDRPEVNTIYWNEENGLSPMPDSLSQQSNITDSVHTPQIDTRAASRSDRHEKIR